MHNDLLALDTDSLISRFGAATAPGLSELVAGTVSHDRVTRFLSAPASPSREL